MSNGFRCRAATRKCHSGHETAARIDATKHAIHPPDAHQVALDRARKGMTRAKHFRKSPALLSALFSTVPVHQEWPQGNESALGHSRRLSCARRCPVSEHLRTSAAPF